jgi:hypothetical protein
MIPIRRSARKDTPAKRANAPQAATTRIEPEVLLPGSNIEDSAKGKGLGDLPQHEPVAVASRGGSLLRLYFTRSFKRRQRPGSDARKSAYRKGDLSSRRDPDFGLPGADAKTPGRPAGFSQALRSMRES